MTHVGKRFAEGVSDFHGEALPERDGTLAGYAALIVVYDLAVVRPEQLALISRKHRRYEVAGWRVFTPRHAPAATVAGHLTFALRYEGVDLAVLRALFEGIGGEEVARWVRTEPVGRYARRAWFFYEWLLGERLELADAATGNFVDALDPTRYFTGPPVPSRRHRVRDNLPGGPMFCPLVRRTVHLEALVQQDWRERAQAGVARARPEVLARATAFFLLQDTRSSFAIEGEHPNQRRAERWAQALAQAGVQPLTVPDLERLQRIVVAGSGFVTLGLRQEAGFIGVHDPATGDPRPDHISARWQDVPALLGGVLALEARLTTSMACDPVITAAMVAFGFVFIHPFADGNGRLHRYLIHHVLMERGFVPRGVVYPLSSVIETRIDDYRRVLEAFSRPRLPLIEWRAIPGGNVEVLNATIDLYRYFDATRQAEFLYDCVTQAIEGRLPDEIDYLERYDRMNRAIDARFDMPSHTFGLLLHFLAQNQGTFSKRASEREFRTLSAEERAVIEALYAEIFGPRAASGNTVGR